MLGLINPFLDKSYLLIGHLLRKSDVHNYLKKILDDMRTNKATFFIKRDGSLTFSRSHLQYGIFPFVFLYNKINESLSVSFSLIIRMNGDIFNFESIIPHILGQHTRPLLHYRLKHTLCHLLYICRSYLLVHLPIIKAIKTASYFLQLLLFLSM